MRSLLRDTKVLFNSVLDATILEIGATTGDCPYKMLYVEALRPGLLWSEKIASSIPIALAKIPRDFRKKCSQLFQKQSSMQNQRNYVILNAAQAL